MGLGASDDLELKARIAKLDKAIASFDRCVSAFDIVAALAGDALDMAAVPGAPLAKGALSLFGKIPGRFLVRACCFPSTAW